MIASTLLLMLTGAAVLMAAAACGYYLVLAGCALLGRSARGVAPSVRPSHRLAVLIPAHNEEEHIEAVLRDCAAFDYPSELFRVYVIADNCTDRTAAAAILHGAICLERNDPSRRGKGPALAWALPQVLADEPDAVLILDADCTLAPHALRAFDVRLAAGSQVLQASYVAANPDAGVVAYVGAVANAIENDLFYAPKSRLGLAVLLRGTGMMFRREVLEQLPWDAASVVEDSEYTLRLAQAGIPVTFVPEVQVRSAFPVHPAQLQVQRTRWIGGNARLAARQMVPLIIQGIKQRRGDLIDLGWTLWVAGRSLVVVQMLLALVLALGTCWLVPGPAAHWLLGVALAVLILQVAYFALGAAHLGLDRRLALLARTPGTLLRLLLIAATSLLPGRNRSWERTPRG